MKDLQRKSCKNPQENKKSCIEMQDLWWSIPDSNRWPLQCESTWTPFQGLPGRSPLKLSFIICARIRLAYRLHCLHQKASKIDTNCGRNCGQLFGVNEILRCGWILTGKTMTETAKILYYISHAWPRLHYDLRKKNCRTTSCCSAV